MTDRTLRASADLQALRWDAAGLVPVVAQDARSGRVLMVAWADREALESSLATGEMHFRSRTRDELWRKGATSGNVLLVRSLHADCDGDTVLALVHPTGPACHTGEATCFGAGSGPGGAEEPTRDVPAGDEALGNVPDGPSTRPSGRDALDELWSVIRERDRDRPGASYTTRLLEDRNLRLKKLGEETAELILAAAGGEALQVTEEGADLLYHVLVVLHAAGSSLDDVRDELARRRT